MSPGPCGLHHLEIGHGQLSSVIFQHHDNDIICRTGSAVRCIDHRVVEGFVVIRCPGIKVAGIGPADIQRCFQACQRCFGPKGRINTDFVIAASRRAIVISVPRNYPGTEINDSIPISLTGSMCP